MLRVAALFRRLYLFGYYISEYPKVVLLLDTVR